jgi:hypothetical protein
MISIGPVLSLPGNSSSRVTAVRQVGHDWRRQIPAGHGGTVLVAGNVLYAG